MINAAGITLNIKIIEEEETCIKTIIYYNISDLKSIEELEKIFY